MSETLRKIVVETMIPANFKYMARDLDGSVHVFENEPSPSMHLMMHNSISLTPHIGAATKEAQERIGLELAEKIISFFNK